MKRSNGNFRLRASRESLAPPGAARAGACTLPTLLSASPAFAKALAKKAAPTRMAFVYVPNGAIPAAWWPTGDGGADFELSPTLAPLAMRNQLQVISGRRRVRGSRSRWRRRSRARAVLPHRGAHQEDGGLGHQGRCFHRPGGRQPDRPPDAFRLAGAHLRRGAQVRRMRFGLRLRLRIQPRVAVGQPAAGARAQSAVRVRAPVRRRAAQRARRQPQAPRRTALHPRLRDGRCEVAEHRPRWPRQAEARSVSDQRARDRAAHRDCQEHAGGESGSSMRPPACPRATRSMSR